MNLVVFGSTGGIGHHVVEQGLQAGHEIMAFARRPEAITIKHPHLRVMQGDVLQPATMPSAIFGQDAVISAIGVSSLKPTTLYSQGVANIVTAMKTAGVRRLVCVSASGIETGPGTPLWQTILLKLFVQRLLRESYADLKRMEATLRASGLDWTSVRPPRLSNGPRTGRFHVVPNRHQATAIVSRVDVADCILHCLNDSTTFGSWAELARN
jgi:putative NADH-flavin reductase